MSNAAVASSMIHRSAWISLGVIAASCVTSPVTRPATIAGEGFSITFARAERLPVLKLVKPAHQLAGATAELTSTDGLGSPIKEMPARGEKDSETSFFALKGDETYVLTVKWGGTTGVPKIWRREIHINRDQVATVTISEEAFAASNQSNPPEVAQKSTASPPPLPAPVSTVEVILPAPSRPVPPVAEPCKATRPDVVAKDISCPSDMITDGEYVYWPTTSTTTADRQSKHDGRISRVPVSGGKISVIADHLNAPETLALDGNALYWVDIADRTLMRLNLGAKASKPSSLLGDNPYLSDPYGVFARAGMVFYTAGGSVYRVPADGGPPEALAENVTVSPKGLTGDAEALYCVAEEGQVWRIPVSGGKATLLSSRADNNYEHAAVGDQYTVYSHRDGNRDVKGNPFPDDVEPASVARSHFNGSGVAYDDGVVYWTTNEGVNKLAIKDHRKVNLACGNSDTLPTEGHAGRIALDERYVYWTAQDGSAMCSIFRTPR
jgi:hypothetical protein